MEVSAPLKVSLRFHFITSLDAVVACRRHAEFRYSAYLFNTKIGDTYFCIATASANFNGGLGFLWREASESERKHIERTKEKEGSLLPAGVNTHEPASSATFPGGYTRVYRYISSLSFWHPFWRIPNSTRNRWKRRKKEKKGRFQRKSREGRTTSLDWRAGSAPGGTQRIE